MQWKHLSSPVPKKFKTQPLESKLMLTIFWDFETCLVYGRNVTNATYCDMLQKGPKLAIHSKRRGRLSEGVLLLHNIHLHTVACTLETFRKLKWEVMEYPAHGPYLVPAGFHLFGLLKEALGGRFQYDEDIKNTMHQ
jgi:hypothetical protein